MISAQATTSIFYGIKPLSYLSDYDLTIMIAQNCLKIRFSKSDIWQS